MIDLARPGCCQVSSSAWVLSGSENIDLASGLTSALPIHTSNWVYQVATHVQDFHADVRKRSATWSSHPSTKTQNLPSGLAPASTRSLTWSTIYRLPPASQQHLPTLQSGYPFAAADNLRCRCDARPSPAPRDPTTRIPDRRRRDRCFEGAQSTSGIRVVIPGGAVKRRKSFQTEGRVREPAPGGCVGLGESQDFTFRDAISEGSNST
ncbi:hypothetical protein JHW43_002615 [Diplocarpon mali]|nr:hypothetical protein JHW43_002615 [Diplocarpon mali]